MAIVAESGKSTLNSSLSSVESILNVSFVRCGSVLMTGSVTPVDFLKYEFNALIAFCALSDAMMSATGFLSLTMVICACNASEDSRMARKVVLMLDCLGIML